MEYRLSVIIPTKNREKYCSRAVESVLALHDSTIQIVVQDNSSGEGLGNALRSEHIKYNHHAGVLSFVDNFSEAVEIADGKYLCIIGDDDAVLPEIVRTVALMEEQSFDCAVPSLGSVYFWPSEPPIIPKADKGYLCLSFIRPGFRRLDIEKGLQDLMRKGGQDYQALDMPRLYHGIVRRDRLQEIYQKTGRYFYGLTPDIYMSTALAMVCKNAIKLNYPITVSGICRESGSAASANGQHTGELKDAPHFRGHDNYSWDSKALPVYSVESIWAESSMKALHAFGRDDLYAKFSVSYLDSCCLAKYPQFREEIKKHATENNISLLRLRAEHFKNATFTLAMRAIRRVFRKKDSVKKFYGVSDIGAAIDITMKELSAKKCS